MPGFLVFFIVDDARAVCAAVQAFSGEFEVDIELQYGGSAPSPAQRAASRV